MAFTETEASQVHSVMEGFMKQHRPPEHIRDRLDLSWRISGQSVDMYEIRTHYLKSDEKMESEVARITYIRKQDHWKLYWMMSDLKWHGYETKPIVPTLSEALIEVKKDPHGCFFG